MAIDDNTSYELTGYQVKDLAQKIRAKADSSSLASVATSGLYSDLTGAPTIPTVYNGTLTIQQNGTTIGTFSANQSTDETINITGGGGASYTAGNGISIDANNEISVDTTVVAEVSDLPTDFTGATSSAAGSNGLVPAPAISDKDKFLKGDGTWGDVPSVGEVWMFSNGHLYPDGDSSATPLTGAEVDEILISGAPVTLLVPNSSDPVYRVISSFDGNCGEFYAMLVGDIGDMYVLRVHNTDGCDGNTFDSELFTYHESVSVYMEHSSSDPSGVYSASGHRTAQELVDTFYKGGNVNVILYNSTLRKYATVVGVNVSGSGSNQKFVFYLCAQAGNASDEFPYKWYKMKTSPETSDGSAYRYTFEELEVQPKLTAGSNVSILNNTISATDTTYSDFGGATSSVAGSAGLVPAPSAGDEAKVLSGAGTWVNQPTVNDATLTIQHNGTSAGTFTANQSTNATVNIETIYADTISPATAVSPITTSMIADGAVTAAKLAQSVFDAIYPVGSIYMSATMSTVAAVEAAFGGTWVAWGSGRVPVGVDANDTDFDTVEETGGEKTHTLTITEMPSHDHNVTKTGMAYSNLVLMAKAPNVHGAAGNGSGSGDWEWNKGVPAQGGDGAHNNLQPYITCYMYKRTA